LLTRTEIKIVNKKKKAVKADRSFFIINVLEQYCIALPRVAGFAFPKTRTPRRKIFPGTGGLARIQGYIKRSLSGS
jgi:hypothetical protein